MDNQHKKIAGYRELNQQEIDLMNEVKEKAEELRVLVEKLENPITDINPDQRWVAIGKTDLQTGCMALVRSIAKQTTF